MAKTLPLSSTASRVFHRFFSTSRSVSPSPLLSNPISRRSSPSSLFHLVGFIPALTRFTTIRTRMDSSGGSYSQLESGSKFSDRPPPQLWPGCDYKHWKIYFIKKPGGKNAITKQQIIDCYVQTLAQIVGSEEEAKRKIYNVVFEEELYAFGCEIDEETSKELHALPEVETVTPAYYADPEYKDYGGELVVNGELVPRSPERQRRITPESDNAPLFVYDGCDHEHWVINMGQKPPAGENATKQQTIDCYVQTLARIVGSEEEAKRKIYKVSCEGEFGFGCEIDRRTAGKLFVSSALPRVHTYYPDAYVDREYKDYGDELFVNGEVVPRPPERQRRIMEITQMKNLKYLLPPVSASLFHSLAI